MGIELNNPLTWIPLVGLILLPIFVVGNMVNGYMRSAEEQKYLRVLDGLTMLVNDLQNLILIANAWLGFWLLSSSQINSGRDATLDESKISAALFWAVALAVAWTITKIMNRAIVFRTVSFRKPLHGEQKVTAAEWPDAPVRALNRSRHHWQTSKQAHTGRFVRARRASM